MGPIGPFCARARGRARGQDIHSILLNRGAQTSRILSPSFLVRSPPARRESSGEKGWRVIRKGGADFRPRACSLCERPALSLSLSLLFPGTSDTEFLPNGRH